MVVSLALLYRSAVGQDIPQGPAARYYCAKNIFAGRAHLDGSMSCHGSKYSSLCDHILK